MPCPSPCLQPRVKLPAKPHAMPLAMSCAVPCAVLYAVPCCAHGSTGIQQHCEQEVAEHRRMHWGSTHGTAPGPCAPLGKCPRELQLGAVPCLVLHFYRAFLGGGNFCCFFQIVGRRAPPLSLQGSAPKGQLWLSCNLSRLGTQPCTQLFLLLLESRAGSHAYRC